MYKLLFFLFIITITACKEPIKKRIPYSQLNSSEADSILKSIHQPVFSTKEFRIKQAVGNQVTNLIQDAIDQAASNGGGTVVIPGGIYYCYSINLKSNVHLMLEEGAILKFVNDPTKYPLVYTWFEGIPCMNFSPMIYAKDEVNIKISGKGIIDGQGNKPEWKSMKYRQKIDWTLLKDLDNENVEPRHRTFGMGNNLRPDLITFINCNKIEISGVSLINAPYWTVHPILCNDVTISQMNISGQGYNQVGIALECCSRILIDHVNVKGMKAGIQINSGIGNDDQLRPSTDILVQESVFNDNRNAISIGPAVKSGVNRLFISGIKINHSFNAINILNDASLKGKIHDIFIREILAADITGHFFYCRIFYGSENSKEPLFFNVHFEKLRVDSCARSFHIDGDGYQPIQNFYFENCTFHSYKEPIAEDIINLSFKNFNDGNLNYNQSFNLKDAKSDKLNGMKKNQDILNANEIHQDELPEKVKEILLKQYTQVPLEDIRRIITKTRVLYEIELLPEINQKTVLLISFDGEIVRTEQEISFQSIPVQVLATLRSILKTEPIPQIMEEVKRIVVQDFIYYEFKGEMRHTIFFAGIAKDGRVLEQKQKEVANTLPFLIKNAEIKKATK